MGYLYYGTTAYAVQIDDRPLAHLKVAILSLMRAGESTAFSFVRPADIGSGRETLWISPTTDLRFLFHGSRPPRINQPWVKQIIESAHQPTGLMLMPEPETAEELQTA
ncbi:hypothetical protein M2152_002777 [Microbacteriaceae bacterium SG_E_30_P1]|uniref:DUF7882 domain-containing protein n=1 Tax=Antiquaquibacter oligotrophicus TaxID=2880260 RepID=A0ABT6KRI2_9MICO|nr:ATP-dependent DNA ligase [Antiquaquibacter oligotrophicus]MDH6182595.1 hypothetical protein [Antiquaquibacter oligotrophicus]UDF14440.1 ATP-dependent DNA ligase [Antiquaquibacter oligotrophicus]